MSKSKKQNSGAEKQQRFEDGFSRAWRIILIIAGIAAAIALVVIGVRIILWLNQR